MRIFEVEPQANLEEFHQTIQQIEDKCQQALAAYRQENRVLFRGVRNRPDIFSSSPRPDRTPKDSSEEGQRIYDEYLRRKGIVAQRHNSIFTSTKRDHAKGYGKPYVVFPIDGFDFCWSQSMDDIIFRAYHVGKMLDPKKVKQFEINGFKWDRNQTIQDNLLAAGHGNLFDMIDWSRMDTMYDASDKNFEHAISMGGMVGHEVMIHGPYYAVEYPEYNEPLSKWLGFNI